MALGHKGSSEARCNGALVVAAGGIECDAGTDQLPVDCEETSSALFGDDSDQPVGGENLTRSQLLGRRVGSVGAR